MSASAAPRPLIQRLLGPWTAEVDGRTLRADAVAGLLGAVLVLPQAIAFAALAGVPPAWGLYTAIVPCIVAALAGSSRHVMSGPTNANALAMAAMLSPLAAFGSDEYLRLVVVATLLVGLLQTAVAVLRLGTLTNFISPAVMLGFTSGAAVLIAWHALPDMLGLPARGTPLEQLADPRQWQPPALALAAATLAVALAARRWLPRVPHLLLALAVAAALGWTLAQGGWTTAAVGAVPPALPPWQPPPLQAGDLPRLASIALALTIIALGQAMAISKAVAARSGQRIDANRECLGQGLSNLSGAFFSCFVSCGSLNRSLPNYEAGARTPLAAVCSALLLALLASAAAPVLAWIPLAGIGALLLLVAWSLVDRAQWLRLQRVERSELAVAAVTFIATLTVRLEVAVLSGVALSLVIYLYRTSRPAMRTMGFDRDGVDRPFVMIDAAPAGSLPECPQLKLLRMEGSVWFGAVAHVADRLRSLRASPRPQRHLLVMAKSMNFIDVAGADLWDDERLRRRDADGDLYFHRPRPQVIAMWQRTGFLDRLGRDHLFADKRSAIATIVPRLDGAVCRRCQVRLFEECARQPGGPDAPPPAPKPSKPPKPRR